MNYFEQIKAHCMAKEGAFEDHPWGETVFKVAPKGKIFCFCGVDGSSVGVKSTLDKQSALIEHPNIKPSAYVGKHGWVTLSLDDQDTFELALDLIDESYAMIAPKPKKVKA